MKIIALIIGMGIAITAFSQDRFITRKGEINFEASVPSFEPVAAANNSVSAILDPEKGEVAVLALIRAFRFENALMEEHFNEEYAESSEYPKAVLEGTLDGFALEKLSDSPTEFLLLGTIDFHGVKQPLKIPVEISKKGKSIFVTTHFSLNPSDFNIDIPNIVREKVAQMVNVHADFELMKQ